MRRIFQSDVLKILLYVGIVMVVGAALAPFAYNLGKGLAEVTEDKQTNAAIAWLAGAAGRAQFPAFFKISVAVSGLALLPLLFGALRLGKNAAEANPWAAPLPAPATAGSRGQPLQRNRQGFWQFGTGFVLAAGLLLLSGWLMVQAGCFVWKDAPVSTRGAPNPALTAASSTSPAKTLPPVDWPRAARQALIAAFAIAVLEEILFRGVLLGVFLRALRPAPAIVSLSLLFAFLHFLDPPAHVLPPDPERAKAGFVLLGQILSRYADPRSLLAEFTVLAAVGVVLGAARYRTASLWLPVGLHAGWRFGIGLFQAATLPLPGLPDGVRWLVGPTLLGGTVPLAVVVMTGFLVHAMTRPEEEEIV